MSLFNKDLRDQNHPKTTDSQRIWTGITKVWLIRILNDRIQKLILDLWLKYFCRRPCHLSHLRRTSSGTGCCAWREKEHWSRSPVAVAPQYMTLSSPVCSAPIGWLQTGGRRWQRRNAGGGCRRKWIPQINAISYLLLISDVWSHPLTFHLFPAESPAHLLGVGPVQDTWRKGVCLSERPASSLIQAGTGWTRPDRQWHHQNVNTHLKLEYCNFKLFYEDTSPVQVGTNQLNHERYPKPSNQTKSNSLN